MTCKKINTSITLFSFPTSPYGLKVACYLNYKKIDYEFVGVSPITFKQVAFTNKRQVPVLQINDEWKLESLDIGLWLEEKFPGDELLGSSLSEKERILEIDKWISDQLIPSMFRAVVDWPSIAIGFNNGWKLAGAVHQATPLPRWVRLMWPLLIKNARFIVAMVDDLGRTESLRVSQQKTVDEFVNQLDGGPFLGGMPQPTLADLSAYPIIAFPYRLGLQGGPKWADNPSVTSWVSAVQQTLSDNPFLVDDTLLIQEPIQD